MIGRPHGHKIASSNETALSVHDADTSIGSVNSREVEISRLTWAVIDGKASDAERHRLAELVSAQHERRHD